VAAQSFLLRHTSLSVVSRGPRGCTVRNALGQTASAPAADVKVVDTVGAGDFFTSGFLIAYLQVGLIRRPDTTRSQ
jgi:fructokinase